MRTFIFAVAALSVSATAYPQSDPAQPPVAAPHEGVAVGLLATPALEGGGPWFMPGLRLSVPLGARRGLDLDTGRIYGADHKYARIHHYYAVQMRFGRGEPTYDGSARYWIAGLRYMDITKLDGAGSVVRHKRDVPIVVGHGWSQSVSNGTRVVSEIGFSGGNGMMVYLSVSGQWGPPRKRETAARDPERPRR